MKIFRQLILAIASLAVFASCLNEEEKLVATAILTDKASMEFGIEDTLVLALTVYADAPWTVESPSWVTVDPATGDAGETVVTVAVEPNVRENLPDRPRQTVLTFVGQDIYANTSVDILQAGDKYRDLVELTMAEALALEADTFVGVKDVQVVALASDGFIAQDQTALSYVAADLKVELGDKGNVYAYVSSLNELPSLAKGDKFVKASNSAVDYSAAKDITSELQAYKASQIELVSITGKYASKKIELYYEEGAERPAQPDSVVIEVLNAHESLALSQYDGWLVEAKGYTVGQGTKVVYFVPVEVKGVKSLETIYFADDFSWIAPMSAADAAGDAVGENKPDTNAPNVWKMSSSQDFFAKFQEIGYQYLWSTVGDKEFKPGPAMEPNGGVGKDGSMYIQKDYLKFGQTSYSGAIVLPALTSIQGQANIMIDFDWCWQVTGSYNPDIMTLTVESNNGKFEQTGTAVSQNLESAQSQEKEASKIEWQHVSIVLTEATPETKLTIRPTYADPDKQNKARHQNRWYLDNIKIIEYTGSVSVAEPTEAEVSITMDKNIVFEAVQAEPITFGFQSDQEATLTIDADWAFFLDAEGNEVPSLTIAASTPTTVKVGAKEHTESEPRTTQITIESGLTVETIPVKQMSPGQKVESFVSLVKGNSTVFDIAGGEYTMTVQANVDYKYESTCDWLTVEPVPATKAMIESASYVVKCAENTGNTRYGTIRVFNAAKNLETVLNVEQRGFDGPRTLAAFPFPYDTAFDGTGEGANTLWNLEQGWLLSNDTRSKMSAHLADDSQLKVTYKYEAAAADGTKDHVRILATGMPKGGYWLFEVPVKDMPAGTYNITYKHSASATGPNYFLVEVSLDGQNWVPVGSQTTTETFKEGTVDKDKNPNPSPREVTWTYALNRGGVNAANVAYVVDVDYAAPALPGENTLYLRAVIADDMAYGSAKAMGGSGTNRIWGPCEITFLQN